MARRDPKARYMAELKAMARRRVTAAKRIAAAERRMRGRSVNRATDLPRLVRRSRNSMFAAVRRGRRAAAPGPRVGRPAPTPLPVQTLRGAMLRQKLRGAMPLHRFSARARRYRARRGNTQGIYRGSAH